MVRGEPQFMSDSRENYLPMDERSHGSNIRWYSSSVGALIFTPGGLLSHTGDAPEVSAPIHHPTLFSPKRCPRV